MAEKNNFKRPLQIYHHKEPIIKKNRGNYQDGLNNIINPYYQNYQNYQASTSRVNVGPRNIPAKNEKIVRKFKNEEAKQKDVAEVLLKYLIVDMLPYSTVEKQGFKEFAKTMLSSYSIPAKEIIKNKYEQLYERTMEIIQREIKMASHVGLSINFWIKSPDIHYIVVFCHYITPDWKLKTANILCKEISVKKVSLKDVLNDLFKVWDIQKKISACTMDNRLIKSDIPNINSRKILNCFGNTLNNTINNEVLFSTSQTPLITKVKRIQTEFIKNMELRHNLFDEIPTTFFINYENNWWSILKLIGEILKETDAFNVLGKNYDDENYVLNQQELHNLGEVFKKLCFYKDLSTNLAMETFLGASTVVPIFKKISKGDDTSDSEKMIINKINKVYQNNNATPFLQKATFLDPRFKNAFLKVKSLKDMIFEEIFSEYSEEEEETEVTKSGIGAIFQKEKNYSHNSTPLSKINCEIGEYLKSPSLDINENPYQWWKNHENNFPRLALLARKYLCASATSQKPDMVFYTNETLLKDNRLSLTSEDIQIFSLHYNRDYLPAEYK